ncbi:hypothetical protein B566_EDAN014836 [Ephemera danica]|nr:hypothetical protein B566_EDAN014836 [Ephemera danica]
MTFADKRSSSRQTLRRGILQGVLLDGVFGSKTSDSDEALINGLHLKIVETEFENDDIKITSSSNESEDKLVNRDRKGNEVAVAEHHLERRKSATNYGINVPYLHSSKAYNRSSSSF